MFFSPFILSFYYFISISFFFIILLMSNLSYSRQTHTSFYSQPSSSSSFKKEKEKKAYDCICAFFITSFDTKIFSYRIFFLPLLQSSLLLLLPLIPTPSFLISPPPYSRRRIPHICYSSSSFLISANLPLITAVSEYFIESKQTQ